MSNQLDIATRKGLFSFARTSAGWRIERASFLGDPVSMLLHDQRDGMLYAALNHGHFGVKLHRSADQGASWEECAVPVYPPKPEGLQDLNPTFQTEVPWKLMQIWSLDAGHPSEPGVLWCGTIPGGLFRSTDRGSSWEMIRSLWDHPDRKEWFGGGADQPGIHSILVDPRDASRVLVGVSCGGAWLTENGGKDWSCRAQGMRAAFMPPERAFDPRIQDPHRIVWCAADPDQLWTQHHNGIFRSRDGARSWTEIHGAQPSNFGFAVAVHPRDPERAWFVPGIKDEKRIPVDGKLVVSRTSDGGKSFEILSRGLPQEHAYDIAFRHALDIDASGERLAFGSTTGSLFASEDGGDSWLTLSNHLPPVYAVRFRQA